MARVFSAVAADEVTAEVWLATTCGTSAIRASVAAVAARIDADPGGGGEPTAESPDVRVDSPMSRAITPLLDASPVIPFTTVLSPTETIDLSLAITMWSPLATMVRASTEL